MTSDSSSKGYDRRIVVPLIERYHAATRETRARWYAGRAEWSQTAAARLSEIAPLLKQPDAATRQIARVGLMRLADQLAAAVSQDGEAPLVDLFGWSHHLGEMNLFGDDAETRANARSFALVLERLQDHAFTREEAVDLLIRLYGTHIRHIGPGFTSFLYLLQPAVYPVLDRKGIHGLNTLFGAGQRHGKEGLKQLAGHLPLIWALADRCNDVLDTRDMGDVSGFLHWLGATAPGDLTAFAAIKEPPADYRPAALEDAPLTITPDRLQTGLREIAARLAIDPAAVEQAVINLIMGKGLILTGPPGTGKTELARLLPRVFWRIYPMVVTATAEWTSYEVIGGLFPEVWRTDDGRDQLRFTIRRGCVYDAVMQNWVTDASGRPIRRQRFESPEEEETYDGVWLVIDEFNRADIDRAFGDLFTALETGSLRVPAIERAGQSSLEIPIPLHFRIIGTLNTFDKHHLFEMSDALKRRFAFVDIRPHPDAAVERRLVAERVAAELRERNARPGKAVLNGLISDLYTWIAMVRGVRVIGTAQTIAALTYAGLRIALGTDKTTALAEGIAAHILPQLEGLSREDLTLLAAFSNGDTEAIFALFEERIIARAPAPRDMHDLHKFARHIAETSAGAARETARRIADLSRRYDEDTRHQLETMILGDDRQPGWRDALREAVKGPVFPSVADALRALAEETY